MARKFVSEEVAANRTRRAMSWATLGVALVFSMFAMMVLCCVLGAVWLGMSRGGLALHELLKVCTVAVAMVSASMRFAKWHVDAAERLTRPVDRNEAAERAANHSGWGTIETLRRKLKAPRGHDPPS